MITPDDMIAEFGADTLRLYEMFTGPLDQSRPWETKAVVGVFRLLQRIWRTSSTRRRAPSASPTCPPTTTPAAPLHRTIAPVREGMETLRFNVSIARITS